MTSAPTPQRHPLLDRLEERLALGRAIRAEAQAVLIRRGRLAEAAAWAEARRDGLGPEERAFREDVARRVSRMFALVRVGRPN
jgi:hypothetical protein